MNFLEALESLGSEAAAVRESVNIGVDQIASDIKREEGGYRRMRVPSQPKGRYLKALTEAQKLMVGVRKGNIPSWKLQEAMSTSDFPILFGDVMYRQLLGNYQVLEPTYPAISQRTILKDFRTLNLEMIDGGRQIPEAVKEYGQYPELSFTESRLQINVGKFGRRFGLSFEMIVNDNLNAFQSRPGQLAIGCRMLEEKTVTQVWVDATGPKTTFGTKLTTNAPFSFEAVQAMLTLISQQRDTDNNPINITSYALVYCPALRIPVQRVMHATEIQVGDTTDATKTVLRSGNWIAGMLKPIENPWIPIIATSASYGLTSWGIFANAPGSGRSALYHGFLQSRETPGMFMKDPNTVSLGGADAGIMEGDFDNDAIDYKTRHFFGAIKGDTKLAFTSNGSGVAD